MTNHNFHTTSYHMLSIAHKLLVGPSICISPWTGFETVQRRHMLHILLSAPRSNHSATEQGHVCAQGNPITKLNKLR